MALPRTKEADEIAERVLARFGSSEKPVPVVAAAAAPAEPAAEETSVRAAPAPAAAPTASADAIAELVVAKLAQRSGAADEGGDLRRHRRDAGAVAAAPRGAGRPPTALPPIVVSAPPTPTPAEAALEQMYVALPFHQRRG